ncbi:MULTISPECIES: hypothetical protein [unclassified Corynebacterium]|uniref:6PGD fold domain-containing protein n=1 Tax=unclassified Corynebacterium TaxID=2624378 RepID=UPI0029CA96AE|nr:MULTISPECIES: hypothetical protein [unclassified Corynebacterium]WPF65858.1 hypothetical protein OLX12_09925 [Corynebacterium sp. 22KM0430]WPF68351.1 hypothetical protein OLW90_09920 [Corynebacterium sp. 21KM1197]
MRVGVWCGAGHYAEQVAGEIATGLENAGHAMIPLDAATTGGEIEAVQAILLGVSARELPEAVAQIAPHTRPHHIVLHVVPGESLEPLTPVKEVGAVVGSLVPLWPGRWAVEYTDELGKTVLELLVKELGGVAVLVSGERRAALATGLSWSRFARDVAEEANRTMRAAVEGTIVSSEIDLEQRDTRTIPALAEAPDLVRQLTGIVDPGRARIFAQLARRAAERDGREEVELWAMQEEKP